MTSSLPQRYRPQNALLAIVFACLPAVAGAMPTSDSPLHFLPHAAAYARESHSAVEFDPHVFVSDPYAPEMMGPESIHHIAGLRPARRADVPSNALRNAQGDGLSLSLGHWLATTGTAESLHDEGHRLALRFTHLIPFGVYSLFISRNTGDELAFTPLKNEDGETGFTAPGDGLLHLTVPLDRPLGRREAILLIYHSDLADHQEQPGDFGVTAHVQLVLSPQLEGIAPERTDLGGSGSDNAPL